MNDMQRHDDVTPIRDAQTSFIDKSIFSLGLPAVQNLFQKAGIARSMRTLQRYCENGSLDARKYNTETGSMWLVNPSSAEIKISEALEVAKTVEVLATSLHATPTTADMTDAQESPASEPVATASNDGEQRQSLDGVAVGPDKETPAEETPRNETPPSDDSELVKFLMKQVEEKDKQLTSKDDQIASLMKTHELDRLHLLQAWDVIITGFELPSGGGGETPEPNTIPASEIRPVEGDFSTNPHPTQDNSRV